MANIFQVMEAKKSYKNKKKCLLPLQSQRTTQHYHNLHIFLQNRGRQRNMSIKRWRKNLWLIKADNDTKPAHQERICLKAKTAQHLRNVAQMALFLWAPEHEGIHRNNFHIIMTCQLAWKRPHICLINVAFPSYCAFRDSYDFFFFFLPSPKDYLLLVHEYP